MLSQRRIFAAVVIAVPVGETIASAHPGLIVAHLWLLLVAGMTCRSVERNYGRKTILTLGTLTLPPMVLIELIRFGDHVRSWDWMFLSGVVLVFVDLALSVSLAERATAVVAKLRERKIIELSDTDELNFEFDLWAGIARSEWLGRLVLSGVMLASDVISARSV